MNTKSKSKQFFFKSERQQLIYKKLQASGSVVSSDLAVEFKTSEDSIRRDLRELASQNLCQKVYGGAVILSPASENIQNRSQTNVNEKIALAKKLVTLIKGPQFIYLDAGSTNLELAKIIPDITGITVATHDLAIAQVLAQKENLECIMVGGKIDPKSMSAMGPETVQILSSFRPDLLILGICSIHEEYGLGAFDYMDSQIKKVLISQSSTIATAATEDKLNTVAKYEIGKLDSLDYLSCTSKLKENNFKWIEKTKVQLL